MTTQHCPECREPGVQLDVGTGWHECQNPDCQLKAYPTRRPSV